MSFSLNFTLPANTTSSPAATGGKEADCGPSLGIAAAVPSLVATALLVVLLFTVLHRRSRGGSESVEVTATFFGKARDHVRLQKSMTVPRSPRILDHRHMRRIRQEHQKATFT